MNGGLRASFSAQCLPVWEQLLLFSCVGRSPHRGWTSCNQTTPHQPRRLQEEGRNTAADLLCQTMQDGISKRNFPPLVERDSKAQACRGLDLVLSQPRRYQQGVQLHPTPTGAQRRKFLVRAFLEQEARGRFWSRFIPDFRNSCLAELGLEATAPGSCFNSTSRSAAPQAEPQPPASVNAPKPGTGHRVLPPLLISSLAIPQVSIKSVPFTHG